MTTIVTVRFEGPARLQEEFEALFANSETSEVELNSGIITIKYERSSPEERLAIDLLIDNPHRILGIVSVKRG